MHTRAPGVILRLLKRAWDDMRMKLELVPSELSFPAVSSLVPKINATVAHLHL